MLYDNLRDMHLLFDAIKVRLGQQEQYLFKFYLKRYRSMMWYFTKIYSMFLCVNKETLSHGNNHPTRVEATDQEQRKHIVPIRGFCGLKN